MFRVCAVALGALGALAGCVVPMRSADAQWLDAQVRWMEPPAPLAPMGPMPPPPPAIVYPPVRGPQACETVCRPLRDGGSRCTNVCYGG